ncbi:hypothetical protein [Rhizobium rhizogenes]|uniref:hypothetical protein n=1 Tax=Rhizobium rhizogenes TaxID=359 RepID=UPI0015717CFF|nr:hypothetical protein [Rhizobium rhizogenes]NTF69347.1 hypothetical protein [Rhizobium rhizogenes]
MSVEWVKKKRGFSYIYTATGIPNAIVDRRGYGLSSAMGKSVTFEGRPFASVEEAKQYAEEKA